MTLRRNSALIALMLFILAEVFLTAYLYRNWQNKQQIHEERQLQSVQTAYQAAVDGFRLATEIYVDEVIRQPDTLSLLQQGLKASDEKDQALARGLLYRALWPSYDQLSENNLRQMQFHQPDGRSYLRFMQTDAWGDDLLPFRPSVRQALDKREPVAAFEAGLSLTGFRYVYPLDWQGENLGSVELSIPFRSIQQAMRQLDPVNDYHLYLQRSIIEPIVPRGYLALYSQTCIHSDFLLEDPSLELPDSPQPPSDRVEAINKRLSEHPSIIKALDAGQMHLHQLRLDRQTWSVTFLPIQDLEGRTVAYVTAYSVDPFAAALRQDFIVNWLLGSGLLIAILLLVYRLLASREALMSEKAYQHAITDCMGESLYALDRQGRFTFINPSAQELLLNQETDVLGKTEESLLSWLPAIGDVPEKVDRLSGALRAFEGRARLQRTDGSLVDVEVTSRPLYKQEGKYGSVTLLRDISERKQTEKRLLLAASVFSTAQEGIIITDPEGSILMVNEAFTEISGYSLSEAEGRNPRFLQSGRHDRSFYTQLWRSLSQTGLWVGEIWNCRKDGSEYLQAITITAVKDSQGKTLHYVGLLSDVTKLRQHQEELEFLAHYDPLTRLPNLMLMQERLDALIMENNNKKQRLLVGKLDLDNFSLINEQWGHDTGDLLLKSVAERLQLLLGEEAVIARLGGDEFAFVICLSEEAKPGLFHVKSLLEDSKRPFYIRGELFRITASIGLTFYPQPTQVSADQLLRQADQAMFQAKQAGKNVYQIFDAEQDNQLRGQYETLARLSEALHNNEFTLFYQPKVNLLSGEVIGVEALIRWQHPERGLVPPGSFLPVMDQQALEIEVSHWVIHQALQQVSRWKQAGIQLQVSINVCAQHLQQADFVAQIEDHLKRFDGLTGQDLQLEILESSVLGDMHHVNSVINDCRRLQVAFSLDDFGTGYSSLAYLKRLPADIIKIDQSFVRDMLDDPDDLAILEGIMGLSRAFDRQVIAEGVETYQHAELLVALGCIQAQGYGIAKPMPAADLPDWLAQWKKAPWKFPDFN